MAKTVVGVFDSMTEAQAVVTDLEAAGFARDHISVMANNAEGSAAPVAGGKDAPTGTTAGHVATGAAIGAGAGLALGLAALVIPGIGPILAIGPIATALAGAGIGAAAGGIIGAMTAVGVPEAHAHHYAEAVRRGGTLVMVHAEDDTAQRAADVLNRRGAVDVETRRGAWAKTGYTDRFDHTAAPLDAAAVRRERAAFAAPAGQGVQQGAVLPVMEEKLVVGKREVDRGGVRVYSHVTERPVEQQVNLREEKVTVERHPVDRAVQAGEWNAFKEGSIEVKERAEQVVVGKEARVVEEVVVGKTSTNRAETVRDTVRRTDVQVENLAAGAGHGTRRAFESYDADFRRDYQTQFAAGGQAYDYYAPAYRYGYDLAGDARYSGRDWSAVERDAQRDWTGRNPSTAWDSVKGAVRNAWASVTGQR